MKETVMEKNTEVEVAEIIKKVKTDYEVKLNEPFVNLYETSFDLYVRHFLNECESRADFIEVLKGFVVEGLDMEATVLDDANVFVVGNTWIYCDEWVDVEWEG